jgi:hypothetical protein
MIDSPGTPSIEVVIQPRANNRSELLDLRHLLQGSDFRNLASLIVTRPREPSGIEVIGDTACHDKSVAPGVTSE